MDYFNGWLLNSVECLKCSWRSVAFDNFLDISLSINSDNLNSMIENFLKSEEIHQYRCSNCKRQVKANRKFKFYKLPKLLVVHLKRFEMGRFLQKIKKPIRTQEVIWLEEMGNKV